MKKKIFGLMAIVVIAAVAAWNVYVSQSKNEMALSDVALENIEALGQENPLCPNGCVIRNRRGCWCYYFYDDYDEAVWP
jgi:hypothetical protein